MTLSIYTLYIGVCVIWDTSYQIGLQNLNLLKLQLELD
jgi:hypothetical protein